MNTKHTPGPWSFVPPNEGTPDITILTRIKTQGPHSKPGETIPLYIARAYGTGEHTGAINQERLANARLIAAAPELLEALNDIVLWARKQKTVSIPTGQWTKILDAITKAEG